MERWRYELERRGTTCSLEAEVPLGRQKVAELEVAEEADDFHSFGLDACNGDARQEGKEEERTGCSWM